MFIGKIMGGNWEEGQLIIGDMPKDFMLSARQIRISELDEAPDLSSLCRRLAEACWELCVECNSIRVTTRCADRKAFLSALANVETHLSDARKAGIIE